MIMACLLYNFIRIHMLVDPEELTPITSKNMPIADDLLSTRDRIETIKLSNQWTKWRDILAK